MAAADGYRLAVRTAELAQPLPPEVEGLNIIVPAKALQELARIIGDDATEPVEMTVTPNKSQVLFRSGSVTLVSRLIEGQFPNYMQVVPKSYATRVVAKTGQLAQTVRIASLFARESANVVKLQVFPSGQELVPGRVAVSANAAEVGDNVSELDALVEGEEIQVAYSARFLSDVLGVLKTEEVALEITGPTSPSVIRPVDGIDYFYVLMPMHSVA
jgi:DNA polymerase-3 subunit beta